MQNGSILGYENGANLGKVDFSAHMVDVDTGVRSAGLQITGKQCIRITTPLMSVAASSSESTTTIHCLTGTRKVIVDMWDNGGSIGWSYGNARFINGLCVSFPQSD